MISVLIEYADGRRSSLDLATGEEWIIGRDESCEICLVDGATSRRHARLYRDARQRYWLQDLKSKNGTLINDQTVTLTQVRAGDRMTIGGCVLSLSGLDAPSIVMRDPEQEEVSYSTTNSWGRDQGVSFARQRLQSLYELNERLTGRFQRDDLLRELLDICIEHLRFERTGAAVWNGQPAHPPQWVQIRNLRDTQQGEIQLSRSIVERALHNGERILITDTMQGDFVPTASMIAGNIRSAMCVPMEYFGQVRGVLYGDRITTAGAYTKEDIDYFAALGRLGAMGLANVQLVEEMQQRQRIEAQLQLARQIQSQLFPAEPLREGPWRIDALNDPGQRVSGDYYDFFRRPDGKIVVVVADVSGKGVPAAMLMANLQAAVRIVMMEDADVTRAVCTLNRLICDNVRESRFITGVFGLLDPARGRFSYVNAGHPEPFILRPGESRRVEREDTHLPLGIEVEEPYEVQELELMDSRGPVTLLFYTDGCPDAENPQGQQLEEPRFAEIVSKAGTLEPSELVARVRRSIRQFARDYPQTDDITLLALHGG